MPPIKNCANNAFAIALNKPLVSFSWAPETSDMVHWHCPSCSREVLEIPEDLGRVLVSQDGLPCLYCSVSAKDVSCAPIYMWYILPSTSRTHSLRFQWFVLEAQLFCSLFLKKASGKRVKSFYPKNPDPLSLKRCVEMPVAHAGQVLRFSSSVANAKKYSLRSYQTPMNVCII